MTVQGHIHLGLTLTGSPEFAPAYKWSVIFPEYQPQDVVIVGLKRGQGGKLFTHRLQNAGTAIKFTDYRLTVKVAATDTETLDERIEIMRAMNGETVYFTKLVHEDDGADHSPSTKLMFLQILSRGKPYTPDILRYDYQLQLTDSNTVT